MHKWTLGALAVVALLVLSEASAFAQVGMPAMPGMGGMGGAQMKRPQRKLKRNSSPVLSPALNMVPGVATSFEGQFLMRTLPQEQINRNTSQFSKQIQGLQNKTMQQDAEIKSGIGKTGHSSRFMNYGSYYSFGGAGGHRGQ
jgi:hypothetical protein